MKAREIAHLLGWKPSPKTYGSVVRPFELPVDGHLEYAQWLHPGESLKIIRQDVIDQLRTFIRPGDVVVDIGAHTGDSTLPMAVAAGPSGIAVALEPNPYVFPVLERNAALNPGRYQIVALPFAATRTAGPATFEYSDAGYCNGGRHHGISAWRHGHAFQLTVRGEVLPEYLQQHFPNLVNRIRYVKIDAEGYDLEVLRTLEPWLSTLRPFLRVEVFKLTTRAQREALFDLLAGYGYRMWRIEHDARYRGDALSRDQVMAWRHFDVFAEPDKA